MPYAASRAASRGVSAEPMPKVEWLQAMYDLGAAPRPGEIWMIAGMSGSQKSTLAMYVAKTLDLPGLYFTPDMPIDMTVSRLAALQMNEKPKDVYDEMFGHPDGMARFIAGLAASKLGLVKQPRPNLQDIWDELDAYAEINGHYPRLIVIDSLANIDTGSNAGELSGQAEAILELDTVARETNAMMIVIHHNKLKDSNGKDYDVRYPQPRSAIKNLLDERPRLITTVGFDKNSNDFRIAVVKNSHGPDWADASHEGTAILTAYPEYAQFQQRVVSW